MSRNTVPSYLPLAEVAQRLGMSTRFVRRRIQDGSLNGFLLGNKIVILSASVTEFMESRRISPNVRKESAVFSE